MRILTHFSVFLLCGCVLLLSARLWNEISIIQWKSLWPNLKTNMQCIKSYVRYLTVVRKQTSSTLQTNPFCTKNYAQPYYDFKLLSNPAQIQPRRANKYSYYHKSSFDGITIRWTFKHVDFIRTYVQIRLEAQFVGGLIVLKDIIGNWVLEKVI